MIAPNRKSVSAQEVLTYDFCPWANRYVYWLKKPVGWLFTAGLIAVLLGIYVAPQGFAVAAAVFFLMLVGMVWPAIAMKGIRGQLQWQRQRCSEGDRIQTILEVSNRWPWPVWGLMVESDTHVVNDGSDEARSIALACLKPLTKTRFVWESKPERRGLYPKGVSYLSTGFPFGIWTARSPLDVQSSLLVWPETIPLTDMPELRGRDACVVGASIDVAGPVGDVIGVRSYREGDLLRNVHWAQSAKRDTLVVRERQTVAKQTISIHLQTNHDSAHQDSASRESAHYDSSNKDSSKKDSMAEWSIRIGATMARALLGHHWSVRLVLDGRSLVAEPGSAGVNHVLDSLAMFEGDHDTTDDAQADRLGVSDLTRSNSSKFNRLQTNRASQYARGIELRIVTADEYHRLGGSDSVQSNVRWIVLDPHLDRGPASFRYQGLVASDNRLGSAPIFAPVEEDLHAAGMNKKVWMWIRMDRPIWNQVKQNWERLCHASLATQFN